MLKRAFLKSWKASCIFWVISLFRSLIWTIFPYTIGICYSANFTNLSFSCWWDFVFVSRLASNVLIESWSFKTFLAVKRSFLDSSICFWQLVKSSFAFLVAVARFLNYFSGLIVSFIFRYFCLFTDSFSF